MLASSILTGLCTAAQVAGLQVGPEYNTHFENLYKIWVQQLASILPPGTNIPAAYDAGSDEDQDFVQDLALFLTAFLRVRVKRVSIPTSSIYYP